MKSSDTPRREWLAGGAAAGGLAGATVAALAGLCCAGPVTFVLLGAGGAVAAAGLKPYRLPLLLLSAALLVVAYRRTNRSVPAGATACPVRVGRWVRRSVFAAAMVWVAALVGAMVSCAPRGPGSPHQVLGADAEPLRAAFNADVGQVRVVMLVSPTCGECLRGASEIEHTLLATQPSPRLRAYVVWVPKLYGHETDVPLATRFVPDPRATHYWDAPGGLIRQYDTVLALGEDAWDIYMLYGPSARWDSATPPRPDFWMHQLGSAAHPRVRAPFLDPATFAAHADSLLTQHVATR